MQALAKRGIVAVTLISASLAAAGRAEAAPIQFGSNYYDFVQVVFDFSTQAAFDANTFALASAAAAASTLGDATGHIATVSSAAENAFLLGLTTSYGFTGFKGSWLVPDGYTNWAGVEPNNGGAFAYMSIGTTLYTAGSWADDSGTLGTPDPSLDPVIGYFVEWDTPSFDAPEPGTLALLVVGAAWMVVTRRRRPRQ
jgi:hypothetical protein